MTGWEWEYYIELYCNRCRREDSVTVIGSPHESRVIGCKECETSIAVTLPTWLPLVKNTSDLDIFIDPQI